jgi:hypothetical protein
VDPRRFCASDNPDVGDSLVHVRTLPAQAVVEPFPDDLPGCS